MSNDLLFIIISVFLLVLYAFFSAAETAFAYASRVRLKVAVEKGRKRALIAQKLLTDYTRTLSTDLLAINLVIVLLTSLATVWVLDKYGSQYEALSTLIITVILLMFGEILPKVLAAEYADSIILLVARVFNLFKILLFPFIFVFSKFVEKISPLWTKGESEPTATVEELSELAETIGDEGVFSETESELIISAIEFSDVDAHDIMIPRVDIEAYDIEDDISLLLENDDLLSYSRIPVFRGSVDNIIGILHSKTFMRAYIEDSNFTPEKLEELLSPVVYAHMTRNISSILAELRRNHLQVAVVVDEFGGTMGMLTLEDILEEIVGDIFDETDELELDVEELGDGGFIVDGSANVLDFFDQIEYEPIGFDSEYTTIGGWATEILDRFPKVGDHFVFDRLDVTITEAQAMRVEKLLVYLLPESNEEED